MMRRNRLRWKAGARYLSVAAFTVILVAVANAYGGVVSYGLMIGLIYAVVLSGLDLVIGYLGDISLAQGVAFGVGGYTAGILVEHGVSLLLAAICSVVGAAIVAGLVAMLAWRVKGIYLVLLTFSLAWAFPNVIDAMSSVTGGSGGLTLASSPALFGVVLSAGGAVATWCMGVVFLFAGAVYALMRNGRMHGTVLLTAEYEDVAKSCGINTRLVRVCVWAVGGGFAGLAGALLLGVLGSLNTGDFGYVLSLFFFVGIVVGGRRSLGGALVGGIVVGGLPVVASSLSGSTESIFYGVLLGIALSIMPGGVVPSSAKVMSRLVAYYNLGVKRNSQVSVAPDLAEENENAQPIASESKGALALGSSRFLENSGAVCRPHLEVVGLRKAYGGVIALSDLSLVLQPGTWLGVVGPNGSGKTTLMDCIRGLTMPDAGSIIYEGRNITQVSPQKRRYLGIASCFQNPSLAPSLSLYDNVAIGIAQKGWGAPIGDSGDPTLIQNPYDILVELGIGRYADRAARDLPYGVAKLGDVGRAMAGVPKLLLLDEPVAGLSEGEKQQLYSALATLRRRFPGVSVLLIEHDLRCVEKLCEEVVAVDAGTVLARGPLDAVLNDAGVRIAFLGVG